MTEIGYLKSSINELSYSCVIPQERTKKVGILFVHAADGTRLGPHRMFVELADQFNAFGFPTLRFDLSGCGDSTGDVSQDDITTDVSDVVETIKFFVAKSFLDGVILFGISRGARVCYMAMVQCILPLKGMILLSMPFSSNLAAINSFRSRTKEYICKMVDPKYLWKLLNGRANIPQIWKTLVKAYGIRNRYSESQTKQFVSKCPILFIYGGADPLSGESSRYYTTRCTENNIPFNCHVIANANHSFFHYKWKEEILSLSMKWLDQIMI